MTSTAATSDHIQKAATGKGQLIWKGVKGLYQHGAWPTLGRVAGRHTTRPGILGTLARGTRRVSDTMSGPVGGALGAYGLTSLIPGVSLPGAELAMNLGTPILGAMNSGANAIRAARMGSESNQQKIRKDVEEGARAAARDYLTGTQVAPESSTTVEGYRKFMGDQGVDLKAADEAAKPTSRLGFMESLRAALSDPDKLAQNAVARSGYDAIHKSARIGSLLGKAFRHTMTPLSVGTAAAGLGHAILSDKPYDEAAVKQQGYAIGQARIQNQLQNLTPFKRFMLNLDPTLAAGEMESALPGIRQEWERGTGARYQPGMLSSTMEAWKSGGKPRFFWTDMGGNNRYIN